MAAGAADLFGGGWVSEQQPGLAKSSAAAGQLPRRRHPLAKAAARHAFSLLPVFEYFNFIKAQHAKQQGQSQPI